MRTPPRFPGRLLAGIAVLAVMHVGVAIGGLATDATVSARPAPATVGTEAWVVVVNLANPLRSAPRGDLERIWRRTTSFWPNGTAVIPINLPGAEPLRGDFQEKVLRSSNEELAQWWNRAYFQGVAPPVVLQTGAAVKAYVALTPGAIGYIPAAEADATVAVVEVDLDR